MIDYEKGVKKDVAEVKFLIHDLRVEWFFNEVIHYHVTLNTELELYSVDQAQALHGIDLDELKKTARKVRKCFREYSVAVKNFSPDRTVLATGRRFVQACHDMCELVLNPLWGRIDGVLAFLPDESRSSRTRAHYHNCLRWIWGVHYRLEHFLAELDGKDVREEFDIAEDLQDFTRNVVYGYVVEKSAARVELRLEQLDVAILVGKRHRFRRMFFNLIMNAVDALRGRKVGMIHISDVVDGDHVVIRVRDDGSGMPPEKVQQLLTDKETLDGELHSLGFVFVRQTVAEFGGTLEIESTEGRGTTVTIRLPRVTDAGRKAAGVDTREGFDLRTGRARPRRPMPERSREEPSSPEEEVGTWGGTILEDYRKSESQHPGCIFAIGVTDDDEVDYFTHRPYERHWNITHEDLAPMLFTATVRGRLEEDEEKRPVLILKAPQNVREYFDFKEVPAENRTTETHIRMVHDEYIRIARKLSASGMDGRTGVHLTDVEKLFPGYTELLGAQPVALEVLAIQKLSTEE
jgi:two-component sensor histidine kinase